MSSTHAFFTTGALLQQVFLSGLRLTSQCFPQKLLARFAGLLAGKDRGGELKQCLFTEPPEYVLPV
jgi:hypothetical protein